MSGDTLYAKGFSDKATKDLVQLFIENQLPTDIDVVEVKMENESGKALVTLSRVITDGELRELQMLLSHKPLQEHVVDVSRVPPTVLVRDLPAADMTEEHLELYFEYDKHGGGEVVGVKLFPQQCCAIVTFMDEKSVISILNHEQHVISDQCVRVERCSPFWQPDEAKAARRSPESFVLPEAMDVDATERAMTSVGTPYPSLPTYPQAAYPSFPMMPGSGDAYPKSLALVAPTPAMHSASKIPVTEPEPEPEPEPMKETICQDTVDLSISKYKALREKITENCSSLNVRIVSVRENDKTAKVQLTLEGAGEALVKNKLYIYEELAQVEEGRLKLSQVTARILRGPAGRAEVDSKLRGLVQLVEVKERLSVVGHADECRKAVSVIEGMLCSDHIKLFEHNKAFMKTESWRAALGAVQSEALVNVKTTPASIDLAGLDHAVKEAKATLIMFLKKNSFKEEKIEVKKGVYRFIRTHCRDMTDDIGSKFDIKVKPISDGGKWFVQSTGCAESVSNGASAVQALVRSVAYGKEICGKPGLAKFFTDDKSTGRRLANSLETDENMKCVIEIRAGAAGPQSVPHRGAAAAAAVAAAVEDKEESIVSNRRPAMLECPVTVVKGDIVKAKADVIVNSVANVNSDLTKCGVIAAAFAKFGGADLSKEFASLGGLKCGEVKPTTHSGSLACKLILHASIRAWDGDRTYKMLCDVVRDCLRQVRNYGLHTIAFPTLGCGKLKYPVREVAKCFREMTATHGRGIKVTLIAFEDEVYRTLSGSLSGSSAPDPEPGRSKPFRKASRQASTYRRKPLPTPQAVTFHINAKTDGDVQTVQAELQAIIKKYYYASEEVNACLEYVEDEDIAKILNTGSDFAIVDIDIEKQIIKVLGEKSAVLEAWATIKHILKDMKKKQADPVHVRKYHGPKGVLQQILKDKELKVPTHWTNNTGAWSKLMSSLKPSMKTLLVDVDAKMLNAVNKLMQDSWKSTIVGHGADAAGLTHTKVQVKKVQRIENPTAYRNYRSVLTLACEEGVRTDFPPVTQLPGQAEVLTATHNIAELEAIRLREVNEYFLFHGTKADVVESIVGQGADPRLGGQGLFGKGLYLAESSTKADQYSDKKGARKTGDLFMVVFRVILGHIYLQKGSAKFQRPPCKNRGCHSDSCPHLERFHSVLGTEKDGGVALNFREFVLFEAGRSYPEFLVTYNRI